MVPSGNPTDSVRGFVSTGVGQSTNSREFLQQRVAAFGLAVAVILSLSLVSRVILGATFGYLQGKLVNGGLLKVEVFV